VGKFVNIYRTIELLISFLVLMAGAGYLYVEYGRVYSVIFCFLFFGFLCALLAYKENKNYILWFFIGLGGGVIGMAFLVSRVKYANHIENS